MTYQVNIPNEQMDILFDNDFDDDHPAIFSEPQRKRAHTLDFRSNLNDYLIEMVKQKKISIKRIEIFNQQMRNTQNHTLQNRNIENGAI